MRGMIVNHKRVARLMVADDLLAVRRRAFVSATRSDHDFEVYSNLAARMTSTGPNQLWVADLTIIRLQKEFVYLVLVPGGILKKSSGVGTRSIYVGEAAAYRNA
jgi:putative transposase